MTAAKSKVGPDGKRPKTGGRKAGTPNKVTKELKEMILAALDQAGGVDYLYQQALETPGPFLALIGKVLPTTIKGEIEATVKASVAYKANIPQR